MEVQIMAMAQSKTFQAGADQVWGFILKTIHGAGYVIAETDTAARRVFYKAGGGGFAWAQLVTVTVSGVAEEETIVTVRAEAEEQPTLTEGGQQRRLIQFIFD